ARSSAREALRSLPWLRPRSTSGPTENPQAEERVPPMSSTDTAFAGRIPALYDRLMVPMLFQPYAEEVARRASLFEPKRILEIAAEKITSDMVSFMPADALDLPVKDGSFDLVVCQFGVMFFPDKVKGHSEARRVLRSDGRYLVVIWDRIELNPVSNALSRAVA